MTCIHQHSGVITNHRTNFIFVCASSSLMNMFSSMLFARSRRVCRPTPVGHPLALHMLIPIHPDDWHVLAFSVPSLLGQLLAGYRPPLVFARSVGRLPISPTMPARSWPACSFWATSWALRNLSIVIQIWWDSSAGHGSKRAQPGSDMEG